MTNEIQREFDQVNFMSPTINENRLKKTHLDGILFHHLFVRLFNVDHLNELQNEINAITSYAGVGATIVDVCLTLVSSEARNTITCIKARPPGLIWMWNATSISTRAFNQGHCDIRGGSNLTDIRCSKKEVRFCIVGYVPD